MPDTKKKSSSKKSSSKKSSSKKSSPKKIYCGTDKPSKNQRLGTLQECHELGQVRLWGLKKADLKKIQQIKKENLNNSANRSKLIRQLGTVSGKMNYIKKNIEYQKNPEKKAQMKEDYKKLRAQYVILADEFKKIEAKTKKRIVISDEEYEKARARAQENKLKKQAEEDEFERKLKKSKK
jgi:hypothetical protein